MQDKNPADKNGWTPLHEAAENGHGLICTLILENVEDKNPRDIKGRSPLDVAAPGAKICIPEYGMFMVVEMKHASGRKI